MRARLVAFGVPLLSITFAAAGPPNDPDFGRQWALQNVGQVVGEAGGKPGADIDAEAAWAIHDGATNVVVAVVGTGVTPHEQFADRLLEGFAAPSMGDDPYDTLDATGDGTRLTGLIAAARGDGVGIAGIIDRAWILPVRVHDGVTSTEAWAAEGIIAAVDRGADVILVALQFYVGSAALAEAVAYAADHDALVVAPAGHRGEGIVAYPAAFDECLAVASTDNLDAAAAFSNYGPQVDLAAPSVSIWSTSADGGYDFEARETSTFAAAHAAAVAALVRSYAPQLSAVQVRQILTDSADDLGAPGWDPVFGTGRLNAARALQMTPPPALRFEFDAPLPTTLTPDAATTFKVRIANGSQQVVPASARLLYRVGSGSFIQLFLQHLGGEEYQVTFPSLPCGSTVEYFFRASGSSATVFDPLGAPLIRHTATVIRPVYLFDDDFEEDQGWTTQVEGDNTTGAWARVVPVGTSAQPAYDFSPNYGDECFVTGQHFGSHDGTNDVDGGPVRLISPIVPIGVEDAEVSYARWFHSQSGQADALLVEISRDGGSTWAVAEEVVASQTWMVRSFKLSDFPQLGGQALRLRFTAADLTNDSLTEAAIDEFRVTGLSCSALRGDADGDDDVDALDYAASVACWHGPHDQTLAPACTTFDFDLDGDADLGDFRQFQNTFGGEGR